MFVAHTPHGPYVPGRHSFGPGGSWTEAGKASVPWIKGGLFLGSLVIPGGAILKLSKLPKLARAVQTLSFWRRPIHSSYAGGSWFGWQAPAWVGTSLRIRKATGAAALGYNLLNPFETIRHAQKGDYDKALINFFYPIVGVPIYDLVEGSSSQSEQVVPVQQNGGPPALETPKVVSDILSLGKISRPTRPSPAKRVIRPKSRSGRRNRCPPGHYWNGRRCVPIRKR